MTAPSRVARQAGAGLRVGRPGSMSALVAVTTVLAVELVRVYPSLLAWQPGARELGQVGWSVLHVAPFVGAAAVVALAAHRDARSVLVVASATLAVARTVTQVVDGDARVALAAIGLLGALAVLAILASVGLPLFGGGVLAGLGVDVALQATLGTRPLAWVHSALALATVVVLVLWLVLLVAHRARREVFVLGRSPRSAVPLLLVAPVLVVQAHLLASMGWVAHVLARGWLASFAFISLGVAVGVCVSAWTARSPSGRWPWVAWGGGLALVALSAAHTVPGWWWGPALVAAQAGVGASLTVAVSRGVGTGGVHSPVVALGTGCALAIAALTVLDGRGVVGVVVAPPVTLVLLGGLVALIATIGRGELTPRPHRAGRAELLSLLAVFGAPALLVVLGGSLVAAASSAAVSPSGELRVVTYNVALAFDPGGRPNLVGVAETLAALDADVIALQEVPRGQLPAGGIDMLGWLEQRLGMPHVAFQAAAPGALHGNAVLSRHPIVEVDQRRFARSGTALPRGAVAARVSVAGHEPVWVIGAHLPPGGTDAERSGRVDALLDLWDSRPRTIVAADLNTRPGSSIVARLEGAGLVSAWDPDQGPGHTFPAHAPRARIDWILHSGDLSATGAAVHQSVASDHLPLLAVVDIG